ncbi:unnamed protein product [Gongylonema pulchrum]|uniref:C-type lectin domain-containing protein n=1 Tax=Gongylonema pulchrum TaxID=637853 RepID=A0A183E6W6_9BILA|nr:unnamed protein product [Gongylonema pulchrum]
MNYEDAENKCKEIGAHISSVDSPAENEFISSINLALESQYSALRLFIGLKLVGGKYVWADGEPYDYSNWDEAKPAGGCKEDFVVMIPARNGIWEWICKKCGVYGAICEIE